MVEMSRQYPQYGFEKHKGYGTRAHYAALEEYGPSPIHRMSFLKKFYAKR
jgi:ribonuclease HII